MGRQITLPESCSLIVLRSVGGSESGVTYLSFMSGEPKNSKFQRWTLHDSWDSPAGLLNSGGLESVEIEPVPVGLLE